MQGSKKKFRKSLRLEMKYENDTPHPQLPTVTPIVSTTTTTYTSTTSSGKYKVCYMLLGRTINQHSCMDL